MYKCPKCKTKFTVAGTGKCSKCGVELQDASVPWKPRESIDKKEKTGSREQQEIIWIAHWFICGKGASQQLDRTDSTLQRLESEYAVKRRELPSPQVSQQDLNDALGELGKKIVTARKGEVLAIANHIEKIDEALNESDEAYRQFVVNLTMFNFRTAGGGRARKIATWLRIDGAGIPLEVQYLRPFEDKLPPSVDELLGAIKGEIEIYPQVENVPFPKVKSTYVPPSRFTMSFPLILEGSSGDPVKLDLGGLKYAFMGSFGFAEPSYTTWKQAKHGEEGPEYDGTRLSLGAYSLCPAYLQQVVDLMKTQVLKGSPEALKGYMGYGGARLTHLEHLFKVAKTSGHALAISWGLQMVAIARALVAKAAAKAKVPQAGLAGFLDFAQTKIARREAKLKLLAESPADLTAFEYVWVQESSLWELAVLGASALSLAEVKEVLDTLVDTLGPWGATVGVLEFTIHEKMPNIPVGTGKCTFERLYAPSGSSAASELYEAMNDLGFGAHGVKPEKEKLDQFVPYFEFYIGGFISEENAKGTVDTIETDTAIEGIQIWVNLSESLHAVLLDEKAITPALAGALIAKMTAEYAQALVLDVRLDRSSLPTVFVVDFTKFAGEMPNSVVYPILAEIASGLVVDLDVAAGVVFLRSNLKYNTGDLERYQSGEVLVCDIDNGFDKRAELVKALRTRLMKYFKSGSPTIGGAGAAWGLRGQYVSLMKKVYLLNDAIASWRWGPYVEAWG